MKKSTLFLGISICLLIISCSGPSVRYYTDLRFNHSSPWYPVIGTHEIGESEVKDHDHYVFEYDAKNRLKSIVNNFNIHTKKFYHPLTHMDSVKTAKYSYIENTEIREFFDREDKPVKNDKLVYKEKYTYNQDGLLVKLEFFDLNNAPMESNWGIIRYEWFKNEGMIVEKRFNMANLQVPMAPYFDFGLINGLVADSHGNPKSTMALDSNLNQTLGWANISSYNDTYNDENLLIKMEYQNIDGTGGTGPNSFSSVKKIYDQYGHGTAIEYYDTAGKLLKTDTY